MTISDLTPKQRAMLQRFRDGDEPFGTVDGLFWIDAPYLRVDQRTLNALIRKKIVVQGGIGVQGGMFTYCFDLDDNIAEQILERRPTGK